MSSPYAPLLAKLAIRRQADVDQATFAVYLEDLATESVELIDAADACERLGKEERANFTTAFPSVGELLAACKKARTIRLSRERDRWLALQPMPPQPKPLTQEEARVWLDKIKAIAESGKQNGNGRRK